MELALKGNSDVMLKKLVDDTISFIKYKHELAAATLLDKNSAVIYKEIWEEKSSTLFKPCNSCA